ncbi:amino acid ABC transporter permease [Parasulfitobacter algicola]|uniref:ABC transporter permease subunit n=1 Tax=Parasulfitobacter algicola TaxID=2614809 RepID=A0ABX2IXQ5_9RHOB|nr:ABC transporter permease subunit [Sulfitobacter algicola]NSX56020.1 ABC transporter permease subunit [Sulfitobacter algicola]
MTTTTDPQPASFRLSMLLNDTRYRSYTFQFIALIVLILFMSSLGMNLVTNLAEQGVPFSFDYLGSPAGYDINQRPIDYNNQDTHLRASIVGVMNTLIVAVLGCVTATFLGVIAGVLRLSNNWLIAKLMAVYVEAFRNVPVLIWILVIFFIMTAALPSPSAFRGDDPASSMLFNSIAFTNRGVYIPWVQFENGFDSILVVPPVFADTYSISFLGLFNINMSLWLVIITLLCGIYMAVKVAGFIQQNYGRAFALLPGFVRLAVYLAVALGPAIIVYAILLSANGAESERSLRFSLSINFVVMLVVFLLSLYVSRLIRDWAIAKQQITGDLPATWHMRIAVIILPTALTLFWLGAYLDYPALRGFNFSGGLTIRGSLIALWLALAVYTGAFIAENVRAGIQAISQGQTEAAGSLGLRPNRIMNLVVLPQALRVIIPPLISQYLNLTKNSSLAIAVGYMDVTGTLGGITLNQTGKAIESVLLLMIFYLTISLSISLFMNIYNNSVKLKER